MKKSNFILILFAGSLFLPYIKYPSTESGFKFISYNIFQTFLSSPFTDKEPQVIILLSISMLIYLYTKFIKKNYRDVGISIMLSSFIWASVIQISPSIIIEKNAFFNFYGVGYWLVTILGISYLIIEFLENKIISTL